MEVRPARRVEREDEALDEVHEPEEARERFGFLGEFIGLDMAASSALTRQLLGWEPTGPDLIEDIEAGAYGNGSQG